MNNKIVEFHILQSFPVTCLNRDDVGAPKTAQIGGVTRARVSSQCWKREVRTALSKFGTPTAIRTKKMNEMLAPKMQEKGADLEAAFACADKIVSEIAADTLFFVSDSEIESFVQLAEEYEFDPKKIKLSDIKKVAKKALNPAKDAMDIALFGRMVASAMDLKVEAACAFSHAISTHAVSNEVDSFTAMDDIEGEEPGSAHMGITEFNSATYYRYISLDLGQLEQTLGNKIEGEEKNEIVSETVSALTKALFTAVPAARQTTQSGACPWDYARVIIRDGQRLQASFNKPVQATKDGYVEASKEALKNQIDVWEKTHGSLYGKVADFEWGEDLEFNIDDLISAIQENIE